MADLVSTQQDIIAVVGVMRCGTSMMMSMIGAGGVDLLCDHPGRVDESNPKGYFELGGIQRHLQDPLWMEAARGKCLKILCKHVPDMLTTLPYRVVFMLRDMDEVVRSRLAMIGAQSRLAMPGRFFQASDDPTEMRSVLENRQQIAREWCDAHASVLYVQHRDVLTGSEEQAQRVSDFLGGLDVAKMVEQVDPALWRCR